MNTRNEKEIVEEDGIETNAGKVAYTDKLITLDNGTLLIARILENQDDMNFVCVYKPIQINSSDDGLVYLHDWIGESSDEFFYIPLRKILTVSTPSEVFLNKFHELIYETGKARRLH